MASVESHKGAALGSRLTIKFFVVTEQRAKRDLPTTRSLSTLDVIAGSIPQRLVLPTFPCVDYTSRGNTGGLHSISQFNLPLYCTNYFAGKLKAPAPGFCVLMTQGYKETCCQRGEARRGLIRSPIKNQIHSPYSQLTSPVPPGLVLTINSP